MADKMKREPCIRFNGFTEVWMHRKLGDTFMHIQNNTLSRAALSYKHGAALNIHYGDVLIKYGEVLDVKKEILPSIIDESFISKYKTSFLKNGDVIVADTAEDETVGKCTEVAEITNEIVISGLHTIPYRPLFHFASGYLGFYMNSYAYHSQLLPLMQGIKVTSISKNAMTKTMISYPRSELEQKQIATLFNNFNNLISLCKNKHNELLNVKKYFLNKMFPNIGNNLPEIHFCDFAEPWEQRKLGELCLEIGDGLHSAPIYDENGSYYFINGNNLVNGKIIINEAETLKVSNETFKKNNSQLDGTTILLSINGTIGNLAYYQGENVMLGKSAAYLKVKNIEKKYLYTVLQTPMILREFDLFLTGTTIKNLGLAAIKNTTVYIPIKEEQMKIGTYFNHLDHLITLHQQKLKILNEMKKSLIYQMYI
ncbi:restriction endonuclease subunit S [[Eubacterium] hominis]|uniref:restriction endonuclease subunit S n=1 Tax=[Eubacterium] hominis TaxID=2764325 RepID=UPI003A4D4AE9